MGFDAAPVIDALENVLAIFIYVQFDHHQTSIVAQCEKINRPGASWSTVGSPKLRMQRGDDQSRIEFRNVATENRFEPGFAGCAIQPMPTISTVGVAILSQIAKQLKPVARVIFIERPTARSFDAKPDSVLIHHAPDARERQAVITKRLAMPRRNGIDGLRRMGDDCLCSV